MIETRYNMTFSHVMPLALHAADGMISGTVTFIRSRQMK